MAKAQGGLVIHPSLAEHEALGLEGSAAAAAEAPLDLWVGTPTVGSPVSSGYIASTTANRGFFFSFFTNRPFSFTGIKVPIPSVVSGNVCYGIYTLGGARLVTTGAVACPVADTTFTVALTTLSPATRYYIAFAADNTAALFRGAAQTGILPALQGSLPNVFPLPATVNFAVMEPSGRYFQIELVP